MGRRSAHASHKDGKDSIITKPSNDKCDPEAFCMYFPSGFNPCAPQTECELETYSNSQRNNNYAVVAKTVSKFPPIWNSSISKPYESHTLPPYDPIPATKRRPSFKSLTNSLPRHHQEHNVDFVGTSTSEECSGPLTCRYVVGEYDPVTQTVSMAPVLGGRVIRMEPRVKGMTYKPIGSNSTVTKLLEEHEPEAAERAAKSRRLVEAFGSQRRLRQMRAGQAGRVEAQHVSGGNAVMGIVANAAAASPLGKAELIAAVLSDKNIPPHNPSATSAEEAYKYDQIVPGSLRESLETALLAPAIDKQEYRRELVDNDTFGGYVPDRTPQLAACNHVIERDQRLRMLILLGHMLKLYTKFGSLRSRNGYKELAEKTKMGESVIEGLVELFYTRGDEEGRWVLTKDKRSLMLSWMLVLAVRAEQNSVLDGAAFSALATQLKMRNGELMGRYKELGCMAASSKVANEEGKMVQSYKIALLPPGSGSEERRTLAESFPALKLGARKR